MSLEECLPAPLRGADTTIARVSAGLSGAGVYRVDAAGQAFVLKVAAGNEPLDEWRRRVAIQQHAAQAGVAPAVVHVDEARRAVVSAFVVDRSLAMRFGNPATRALAVGELGRMLRRVHELPLVPDAEARDLRSLLGELWAALRAGFAVPAFAGDVVGRVLAESPPPSERPPVLSHNDVNPTNLVWDGERLLLVDWDTAGPNDPFFDLAAIAVFLRMDDETCRRLLAAHDGTPPSALPARFGYDRRIVAALCGTMFLNLARLAGHAGADGSETLASAPSLLDVHQAMRTGALSVASADGRWRFGLALLQTSAGL